MNSNIIHIGYHKSASAFLQKTLFQNIDVNCFFLSLNCRKKNVRVLPMDVIKKDSNGVMKTITNFRGVKPPQLINNKPVNKSTKLIPVITFWLAINYIFSAFIKILTFILKAKKRHPFAILIHGFYKTKSSITELLNRIFKSANKIELEKYSVYKELYDIYADNNKLTQEYTHFELKKYRYPF